MTTSNKYLIAFTAMLGTLMEVVDTSVANVALPHMQGTFSAGTDEITWVITSYLVANAVILPITGWLGNFFGRKRFYLSCLALFTLASLGSGAAPSLWFLILMRVIQGFAGGAMVPMSQAILLESFPKEERGKAMALFGVGVIFGPIIGPTLGGWITDTWNWRWIFYINIPVGVLAFLLGLAFIENPEYMKRPEGKVDYASFFFIALGLGSLEVFLNRGQRFDWFKSPFIKTFAALAALGIALFIWRSFTAEKPLVNLRLFKNTEFATGTLLIFLVGFGLYGSFVMLPLFVQNLLGYTATWAGLVLSPGGIASLFAMVFVGNLIGKVDTRFLVVVGVFMNILSLWLLWSINLGVDFQYVMWSRIFQGFGLGFLFVPITTAAYTRIQATQMGDATGLFNLLRNEGGSVGIALSATLLSQRAQFHQTRLVENLTPLNPVYQERLNALTQGLFLRSGHSAYSSGQLALGIVQGELQRQAVLMAFVDVFFVLTLVFVMLLPFIFLLKGKAPAGTMPPGH
ncbi:MAG: DHA2 family efflux MFS transporter permease subunit [Acidobacteria bacterium]|nr:DHA2 family efflux MFS transporter permease subunit [Acidobacteriota bacterium]